jgi:hypothetical protein
MKDSWWIDPVNENIEQVTEKGNWEVGSILDRQQAQNVCLLRKYFVKLVLEDYGKETVWFNLYYEQLCPHHVHKQLCPHHVRKQLCPHHVRKQQQNKTKIKNKTAAFCISVRQSWIANSWTLWNTLNFVNCYCQGVYTGEVSSRRHIPSLDS